MRSRALLVLLLVGGLVAVVPTSHAAADLQLSQRSPKVTWTGMLTGAAPLDCHQPNLGCDERTLVVHGRKGDWVTVAVDAAGATLRVTSRGRYVGSNGQALTNPSASPRPSTTFQHLATGRVPYLVQVGVPASAAVPQTPVLRADSSYRGMAHFGGKAFDRAGDCGITSGAEHLLEADPGETLRLSVRLVGEPADAPAIRMAGRALVDTYARLSVAVRVTYDFRGLRPDDGPYPYLQVRRAYGGVRPAGVDVVHVMSEQFQGGFADCLGGIGYPEKAFSTGSITYNPTGRASVPTVRGAMIAAHEIGHLLGAQHQQANCVEALPQLALRPAQDGSTGACTVMFPAAAGLSETFSSLERATIRSYVRRFAQG